MTATLPITQATSIVTAASTVVVRRGFLGAFFRAIGSPPYGVFSATATQKAPTPYPSPTTSLLGTGGYCNQVAANGVSISSGLPVDPTKLSNIVNLGVKWARMTIESEYVDQTHIFGPTGWGFQTVDSAQCALAAHGISPIVGLEAGPVEYDATPNVFSPTQVATYKTAADFATYCGAVAKHQSALYSGQTRYSLPDNEVNTNPTMFPGGNAQIAAYSQACYQAIKANAPNSFVYGFELNMAYNVNAPGFVSQMYALGCKIGTCYDGISMHLYLPYPIPPAGTPCFPTANGNYDMQCVTDIRTAAHQSNLHILIGETAYTVTASVPDEQTKATAVVAAMELFAQDSYIDGVNYANVDECALYPTGYFAGGCLISVNGTQLPAYGALQSLAVADY